MARNMRLGWLPLVQLMIGAALIAAGMWLYYNIHLADQVARAETNTTIHFEHRQRLSFNFPAGGNTIFPEHRVIALYGAPGAPVLGALGQQDVTASIQRIKQLSQQYQPYMQERALPAFEIIATVASEFPTQDNDYSREIGKDTQQEWITAARKAGIYVLLDLQRGRTDFLTQARRLTPLLSQPNVGLALDPEWRLKPHEVPLVQIGAVPIQEVNATANWLATLTRRLRLPQKLFLLHQFRNDMLPNRTQLNVNHPELAYTIQMDGQGSQAEKQSTWQAILRQPPSHTRFGWKNFYAKDTTLLTPDQTMLVRPKPWYVSYQ